MGEGKAKIKSNGKFKIYFKGQVRVWALCAHTVFLFGLGVRYTHTVFDSDFDLPPPVHRLDFSSASGAVRRGLSEHVAA